MIDDIKLNDKVIKALTTQYNNLYNYYKRQCTIYNYTQQKSNILIICNMILTLYKYNITIQNIHTLEFIVQYYNQQ